jgi:hypothetical protein
MKKLLFLLPLTGLIFLCGCETSVAPSIQPITGNTITTAAIIDCTSDETCIQTNFITCAAATFTPPFSASVAINIAIIGETNKICDYNVTKSIQGMLVNSRCLLPIEFMTAERIAYILSANNIPGADIQDPQQLQLDNHYCTQYFPVN